jgi:putative ABC transport system substrate-binding protein
MKKYLSLFSASLVILSVCLVSLGCGEKTKSMPTIGYVQMLEDATIDEAKRGFITALQDEGYEDGKNIAIDFQNAQNDMVLLNQILDKFIADKVDLIAANTTVATIAAVQKTNSIPVCMMVAPRPDIANLTKADGSYPKNLLGTYETLAYIDTSIALIKQVFPEAKTVGTAFNFTEPNSINARGRLMHMCDSLGLELVEASLASSNETQQVVESILTNDIDVFFALPDNIIFSSFETVYKLTNAKKIPIVSSEMGLVKRGALMAYGADFYEWGYQAGQSAVKVLGGQKDVAPDKVKIRKRAYNPKTASELGIDPPEDFEAMK